MLSQPTMTLNQRSWGHNLKWLLCLKLLNDAALFIIRRTDTKITDQGGSRCISVQTLFVDISIDCLLPRGVFGKTEINYIKHCPLIPPPPRDSWSLGEAVNGSGAAGWTAPPSPAWCSWLRSLSVPDWELWSTWRGVSSWWSSRPRPCPCLAASSSPSSSEMWTNPAYAKVFIGIVLNKYRFFCYIFNVPFHSSSSFRPVDGCDSFPPRGGK